ncbi:hypothetical protein BMS3Abin16_01292 [archaeon BMS3Abin16]|nr:hypothetical protein BMS3Abin16_01292 [archaeon BMS3Abin16]GBE56824.1 hypothetical protein BMS3Bbin16_01035 [archaeon BMS3Bbin16]
MEEPETFEPEVKDPLTMAASSTHLKLLKNRLVEQ